MLSDRGYVISEMQKQMTLEQFQDYIRDEINPREKLLKLFAHNDNPEDRIFAFFSDKEKLKVDDV